MSSTQKRNDAQVAAEPVPRKTPRSKAPPRVADGPTSYATNDARQARAEKLVPALLDWSLGVARQTMIQNSPVIAALNHERRRRRAAPIVAMWEVDQNASVEWHAERHELPVIWCAAAARAVERDGVHAELIAELIAIVNATGDAHEEAVSLTERTLKPMREKLMLWADRYAQTVAVGVDWESAELKRKQARVDKKAEGLRRLEALEAAIDSAQAIALAILIADGALAAARAASAPRHRELFKRAIAACTHWNEEHAVVGAECDKEQEQPYRAVLDLLAPQFLSPQQPATELENKRFDVHPLWFDVYKAGPPATRWATTRPEFMDGGQLDRLVDLWTNCGRIRWDYLDSVGHALPIAQAHALLNEAPADALPAIRQRLLAEDAAQISASIDAGQAASTSAEREAATSGRRERRPGGAL